MGAEAQNEVQLRLADFQQQVGIAGEVGDQAGVIHTDVQHDGGLERCSIYCRSELCSRSVWHRRCSRAELAPTKSSRCGDIHRLEAHLVSRLQLTQLPQVRLDHRHRADEAAKARAVRAEDDRHVAGEVHRADGVRVVVDVRRMQAGLAAAVAHPFRFRADQAHAGAAGVEVHFPVGGEEGLDIGRGEIFRRAVRAVDHADAAQRRQRFAEFGGQAGAGFGVLQRLQMQHVAGT
ncbi:hypothetical protein D3C76_866360 [compost metagenome]